jgi:hypothetical protein
VDGSSADHTAEATGYSKRQAQPLKGNFEKLLKQMCPNHTYAIKHKLRDCSLMKRSMIIGSLSRVMEVNEAPIEGDAAPFLGEDAVMMIVGRRPSSEKCRKLDRSTGTPSHSD